MKIKLVVEITVHRDTGKNMAVDLVADALSTEVEAVLDRIDFQVEDSIYMVDHTTANKHSAEI